jgi:hypothetical protein
LIHLRSSPGKYIPRFPTPLPHSHTATLATQPHLSRTCLMKISRSRLCPKGLYLRLNLSNLHNSKETGFGADRLNSCFDRCSHCCHIWLHSLPAAEYIIPVKGVLVGVHVQGVYVQIVARHAQRFKHLTQRQPLAIPAEEECRGVSVRLKTIRPGKAGRRVVTAPPPLRTAGCRGTAIQIHTTIAQHSSAYGEGLQVVCYIVCFHT